MRPIRYGGVHIIRFLFFVFCFVDIAFAQHPQVIPEYKIRYYTQEDGLSQSAVNAIVQDRDGFLWLGTQDGLNRFDGTSFINYRHDDANPKSISGNYIFELLADDDKIWVGTRSAGLCYFDLDTGDFTTLSALRSDRIFSLAEYKTKIYVATGKNGLAILTRDENKQGGYAIEQIDFFGKNNESVQRLFVANDGYLWVGTNLGNLYVGDLNAPEFSLQIFPLDKGALHSINVIEGRGDGVLWIGTEGQLKRLDIERKMLTSFRIGGGQEKNRINVFDMAWDGNDLWLATGLGIFVYRDGDDKRLIAHFKYDKNSKNSLSASAVYCLFFDSEHQVWAGTINYLDLLYSNPFFHTLGEGNIVFSVEKNGEDIWFATLREGLKLYRDKQYHVFSASTGNLVSDKAFSTLIDRKGVLWVGTYGGISLLKHIRKKVQEITVKIIVHDPDDSLSIGGNNIRQIYQDRHGDIWVCVAGGGLNRFIGNVDNSDFRFINFQHNPNDSTTISSDGVHCINQLDKKNYLVGTRAGINVMTRGGQGTTRFTFHPLMIGDSVVLNDEAIYDILVASDSVVWIGTTKGLYHLDLKKQKLATYGVKDGMSNEVVYRVIEDDEGNIWLSTNDGIARFDPREKTFTNYNMEDGLPDREFTVRAGIKDKNGNIYFGSGNGIVFFRPASLQGIDKESEIFPNSIEITNPDKRKLDVFPLKKGETLRLKKENFPFYVNFTDIDLRYYKNTSFAYRLKPNDKNWNYIKKDRRIQFLGLSPGTYSLEIQGVSRAGVWQKSNPLVIPIVIIPPWWASRLAYLVYGLLLLGLLYSTSRFVIKRKLERQERLRLIELDDMKTRLYNNIAHEFKTPLTVIMGQTDNLAMAISPAERAINRDKFNSIKRNSRILLRLINQMLDLSKVESGEMQVNMIQADVVSYLKILLESFRSYADTKEVHLEYEGETDSLLMDFDPDKLGIIISNLVSNGIKFTGAGGKISLHLSKDMSSGVPHLVLKLVDTGIGITPENLAHIFDRFYQVDTKNVTTGTGIGLSLTKELVELMNGSIVITSAIDKGTTCIVKLPITNKATLTNAGYYSDSTGLYGLDDTEIKRVEETQKQDLPIALLVEDNKDVASFVASCLAGQYNVMYAEDGEAGVDSAIKNIPDIVVTDLMMPKKDGFALCRELKTHENTSHIPIIMLTARSLEEDKLKGYACGADAYLIKPFNRKELLIRVEQLILLRKRLQEKYQRSTLLDSPDDNTVETRFLNKCKNTILESLEDENFKTPQLAQNLHMSESQLYRKIKALTGMSIAVFIRDVKLSVAREMLKNSSKSVSDISYDCGFSNPAWFGKAFREKFNCSPSEYRKRQKTGDNHSKKS